ncbi:MAG TPA: CHAT domain-containing protein [Kribbella sp.]
MAVLRLEATDVAGPDRWRWTLTDPGGRVLVRYDVHVDPGCPQYEAAADLPAYFRRHTAPDRRGSQEAAIVREVGEWLRSEVLGPVADALSEAAPAVVQVVTPRHATYLHNLPLELARIGGRPLALQDVTLVWSYTDSPAGQVLRGDRPIRVLALFSQPDSSRALNLRRERQALQRCFTRTGRAVEFRTLQYGVSRARLRAVLAEPDGWDLIHVSGHGTPGELLLETETGQRDLVTAADLTEMLGSARGVKLVTLSTCWSAAAAVRAQLRRLELPPNDDTAVTGRPLGATANVVADQLGCAVLAMRYPVADDFAIGLAERLYSRLIVEGSTLPEALAVTLPELAEPDGLQAATPTLVGAPAAELVLRAPQLSTPAPPDASIPVPERFVGRVAVMARAGAALSPHGAHRGVLLQGMPGLGKTACAAELAATHRDSFDDVIWFQVPPVPSDVRELTIMQEQRPPGRRTLLVVDGIDPLLDDNHDWRDGRWLDALTEHERSDRVILTCRSTPRVLPPGLRIEPIGLLTQDESMLMTRELPNFARLLNGDASTRARRHARTLIDSAGGHPQLLELADSLCGSQVPASDGADLQELLHSWTKAVIDDLRPEHRDLFLFLCCLEPADRMPPTVEHNWPMLSSGIEALVERGLVTARPSTYDVQPAIAAVGRTLAGDTVQSTVDHQLSQYWLMVFRMAWHREGTDADEAHLAGPLLARAGLSAAPYLARTGELQSAEVLLEAVLRRDTSRQTIARVHPLLRWLATLRANRTSGEPLSGALDVVLDVVKPDEAERQARDTLERARSTHDHALAASATGRLIEFCVRTGRLEEAIALADEQIDHVRRAGLGDWTRLHSEVQRVHVLAESRYAAQALIEVAELRRRAETLPRERSEEDAVLWWQVWEELDESGQRAAVRTANWEQALSYNEELRRAKQARGAPAAELAQATLPAYWPLAQLGRTDEALSLLDWCRLHIPDGPLLGEVLGAIGNVEYLLGHRDVAIARAQDALRYADQANVPSFVAVPHANLGDVVWAIFWEPVIAALVAAVRGDTAAYIQLRRRLNALEQLDPQFATLPAVLRRIHDGERGPGLLAGLGPRDASIAVRAQDVLDDRATIDVDLWPALHLGAALASVVATATGDQEGSDFLEGDPELAPLADVLTAIVGGSRDSGLPGTLDDPTHRAMTAAVLHHIAMVESAPRS